MLQQKSLKKIFTESEQYKTYYGSMDNEDEKVKVELDLPKDQVSLHSAGEDPTSSRLREHIKKEELELKKTQRELEKVKKERNELREKREPEEKEESEDPVKAATGYELGEIVTAPLHPPEPETKKKPVRGQIHNLFVGFGLMPIALIALLIFGWQIGIAIALVGAAFIAMGVLFRI